MSFRLIDTGWDKVLEEALVVNSRSIRIVCPFIKRGVVERLLQHGKPASLLVITRFNLCDFSEGVSDTSALRLLLEYGAQIRGIRHLHAKLYLFGDTRVIVTSANLTDSALSRNHEFGFVAEDSGIVERCTKYFGELWGRAGQNLQTAQLTDWERKITSFLAGGARPAAAAGLGDQGVNAGIPPAPVPFPVRVSDAEQSFVKFFGEGHNRADRSMHVLEEVRRSGSHWACTFPKGKRPRGVQDGSILFMGRLVREPADILIYGRAVGMRHEPGRDDATANDIQGRGWKAKWPHYVRVHHAEFIDGSLANGISLNELMNLFKADSFAPTQRNARAGRGNTDPRKAYMQQPAVELSPQGMLWLDEQLERAYVLYGKLPVATLEELDWPAVSVPPKSNGDK